MQPDEQPRLANYTIRLDDALKHAGAGLSEQMTANTTKPDKQGNVAVILTPGALNLILYILSLVSQAQPQ